MSDGMGRELAYLSSHATNRYFIPNWGIRIEVGGIFEKCDSCQHRIKGLCSGGCLSHSLNKFVKEERIRNAQVYPNTLE